MKVSSKFQSGSTISNLLDIKMSFAVLALALVCATKFVTASPTCGSTTALDPTSVVLINITGRTNCNLTFTGNIGNAAIAANCSLYLTGEKTNCLCTSDSLTFHDQNQANVGGPFCGSTNVNGSTASHSLTMTLTIASSANYLMCSVYQIATVITDATIMTADTTTPTTRTADTTTPSTRTADTTTPSTRTADTTTPSTRTADTTSPSTRTADTTTPTTRTADTTTPTTRTADTTSPSTRTADTTTPSTRTADTTNPSTLHCQCGWNSLSRIVGGTFSAPNHYPWQARLIMLTSSNATHLCGGTLIAPNWVMTAAHCVEGIVRGYVYLGDQSWSATDTYEKKFAVSTFIKHSLYSPSTLANDIALIKLPSNAVYTNGIQPACLPFKYSNADLTGSIVTATGWGRTSTNGPIATTLQQANMTVITNALCRATFGPLILQSNICTWQNGSTATCQGDSGGPLGLNVPTSVSNQDITYVVGVTSFSSVNGCNVAPNGFTRVTSYLNWVQQKTEATFCNK